MGWPEKTIQVNNWPIQFPGLHLRHSFKWGDDEIGAHIHTGFYIYTIA